MPYPSGSAELSAVAVVAEKIQPEQAGGPGPIRFPSLCHPVNIVEIRDLWKMRTRCAQQCDIPGGMSVWGRNAPQECGLHGPWTNSGNGGEALHGRTEITV